MPVGRRGNGEKDAKWPGAGRGSGEGGQEGAAERGEGKTGRGEMGRGAMGRGRRRGKRRGNFTDGYGDGMLGMTEAIAHGMPGWNEVAEFSD